MRSSLESLIELVLCSPISFVSRRLCTSKHADDVAKRRKVPQEYPFYISALWLYHMIRISFTEVFLNSVIEAECKKIKKQKCTKKMPEFQYTRYQNEEDKSLKRQKKCIAFCHSAQCTNIVPLGIGRNPLKKI